MATASSAFSVSRPRFGRPERTEIRADIARDIVADMKAAYLADDRPWVVGFSGGKDSAALVQFLYYMFACIRCGTGWNSVGPASRRSNAGQTQTRLHPGLRHPRRDPLHLCPDPQGVRNTPGGCRP